jgi:hypothetical protein
MTKSGNRAGERADGRSSGSSIQSRDEKRSVAARRKQAGRRDERHGRNWIFVLVPVAVVIVIGLGILWYSSSQPGETQGHAGGSAASVTASSEQSSALASVVWPTYVSRGGPAVTEGYQFAVLRPDVLQYMPCYCGCGQHNGHRSNEECFVANMNQGGRTIAFESHGST